MDSRTKLHQYFPIGTKYPVYRDLSDKYWETDFTNMKACGMDTVRIHATWSTIELTEGSFTFDYYDRITEAAARHGLKIIFTLYLVCTPEWEFEKHPDSRYVSLNGTVWDSVQHSDACTGGWPGLCYDSEDHRASVENFLRAFTTHYRGNGNILAFDVFHEPTEEPSQQYYQNDWREKMYCYCMHSVKKFRIWLERKYGSLQGLNDAWTRHYERWDQVFPPKNVGMYTDWLDFKSFRIDSQVDEIAWLSQTVKKYDSGRFTVVHTPIFETGHRIVSSNDHFKLAPATDMFGSSVYDTINPEISGAVCDLLRSASDNGPYWIGETGTGAGPMYIYIGDTVENQKPFSLPIDGMEIKRQSWAQVARGAKGIIYWGWRPDISTLETVSLGFTERNGELTDRTDALKEFTAVFNRYRKAFVNYMVPDSEVAILYNMDSIFQEGLISLCTSGNTVMRYNERFYKDLLSMFGAYKLCMKNGIQPDFISREKSLSGGLSQYKVLLLPYSINISKDLADKIGEYVEAGGKVVADGLCGFFTDGGWGAEVCPAGGLDRVFGLHVSASYGLVNDCDVNLGGRKYKNVGRCIRERIKPHDGAQIKAHFDSGEPAVIKNAYGKGETAYIGTLFFASASWNYSQDTNELFESLLACVGYRSRIKVEGTKPLQIVETRVLRGEDGALVFVINQSGDEADIRVTVPIGFDGVAEDLFRGEKLPSPCLLDQCLRISEKLEARGVRLYLCKKG